jgi:hypothetical protein
MQAEEPVNFLKLAASLKIIVGSSVREDLLSHATDLLQDYLCGFRKVYFIFLFVSKLIDINSFMDHLQ